MRDSFHIRSGKKWKSIFDVSCFFIPEKVRTRRKLEGRYAMQKVLLTIPCRKWFIRLREENFELSDVQRSGRPIEINTVEILALIESD